MKVIFIWRLVHDDNIINKNNYNNSSNNNTNDNDNGNNNSNNKNSNWYLIYIDLILFMYFVDLLERIMYNITPGFW